MNSDSFQIFVKKTGACPNFLDFKSKSSLLFTSCLLVIFQCWRVYLASLCSLLLLWCPWVKEEQSLLHTLLHYPDSMRIPGWGKAASLVHRRGVKINFLHLEMQHHHILKLHSSTMGKNSQMLVICCAGSADFTQKEIASSLESSAKLLNVVTVSKKFLLVVTIQHQYVKYSSSLIIKTIIGQNFWFSVAAALTVVQLHITR